MNKWVLAGAGLAAVAVVAVAAVLFTADEEESGGEAKTAAIQSGSGAGQAKQAGGTRTDDDTPVPRIVKKSERKASQAGANQADGEQVAALPEDGDTAVSADADGTATILPSFDVVRIERSGETVLAGRAAPNAEVTVRMNGKTIGTVTANSVGEWVLIPDDPLPPGDHELDIVATANGKTVESDEVVVVSVPQPADTQVARSGNENSGGGHMLSGTTGQNDDGTAQEGTVGQGAEAEKAPGEPLAVVIPRRGEGDIRILQGDEMAGEEGVSDQDLVLKSVEYDDEGNVVISGEAPPGSDLAIYMDNELIGRARTDEKGNWDLRPAEKVASGLHKLRVDQVSSTGQVIARVAIPFSRAQFATEMGDSQFVVVQPGNSLWVIARRVYGEGVQYASIYRANTDQIEDPDLIYPGQVFMVPSE